MVTFLDNLPSFDKENFSNFQPDLNQCVTPKKQSFIVCSRESSDLDEQIIVNQKCNIIIQYLNDQNNVNNIIDANNDGNSFPQQINSHKAKKRDIRDVLDLNNDQKQMSTSQTCTSPVDRQVNDNNHASASSPSSPSSKYLKKRKLTSEQLSTSSNNTLAQTSSELTTGTSSSNPIVQTLPSTSYDELIEIDDTTSATTSSNLTDQTSGFMH